MTPDSLPSSPKGSVRLYPYYRTRLGEAIFTESDHFTLELRGFFSEMLATHFAEGGAATSAAFADSLAKFTPASVDEAGPEWKEIFLKRWMHEQRPAIYKAMQDYLVHGGHQARVQTQEGFLDGLLAAGVEIDGLCKLREELAFSGDWHAAFIGFAHTGRALGIRFSAPSTDRAALDQAARLAGFSSAQALRIWANF